jgi:hypothetical protein
MNQPESLEEIMRGVLTHLGLPAPSIINSLQENWADVAGEPWAGQSRPLFVRDKELMVEAVSMTLVGMLRYCIGDLLRRLDRHLGEGVVDSVRVIGPTRG